MGVWMRERERDIDTYTMWCCVLHRTVMVIDETIGDRCGRLMMCKYHLSVVQFCRSRPNNIIIHHQYSGNQRERTLCHNVTANKLHYMRYRLVLCKRSTVPFAQLINRYPHPILIKLN